MTKNQALQSVADLLMVEIADLRGLDKLSIPELVRLRDLILLRLTQQI